MLKNAVFFNRVSKAGSGTLIHILRFLTMKNGFTLTRDSGFNGGREDIMLSYEQQVSLWKYSEYDVPCLQLNECT